MSSRRRVKRRYREKTQIPTSLYLKKKQNYICLIRTYKKNDKTKSANKNSLDSTNCAEKS